MLISFDCPKCLKIAHGEVTQSSRTVNCTECGWNRDFGDDDLKGESPQQCLVCGCSDLWRQKDFDRRLGVGIVGLSILIYLTLVAFMMPGIAMIVLMVIGLADWVLYAVLPDRLVCYRCHAQYRRITHLAKATAFDLEVNERYRQEAIRLKKTEQASRGS